ncbi:MULTISPECIES: DUF4139 domain-containing protein [unclassified Brevundimonas]|uniref:DUF4139 domain-containing protein n=1 Tax=unclassified Brevundimonas TaxID=2622653 RepID=UPI0025BEAFA5|nr:MULTISPECIES: DUF4139 domain-containing protein [unclassified Brevundimonas]
MRQRLVPLLAAALCASTAFVAPALAQQVESGAGGPDRLALTVYNNNIALVEDVRTLTIQSGRVRQEFPGVSASIQPETVTLSGRGLAVVEQNFDYDLLTPRKLMEGAVGQQIEIVRTNPGNGAQTREQARVLSANEGVVLQIGNRIEVLRDDGAPTRVVFDGVPPNLRPRPTLSVTLDATGTPRRDVTLNYLTSGLQWKADYVARFDEKAGRLDLNGWVTMTNNSGSTFTDAVTRVVAGAVNTTGNNGRGNMRGTVRGNGTGTGANAAEGDAHVYLLPERVTVANNQTKQVGLLDVSNVPATKRYVFQMGGFGTYEAAQAADVGIVFRSEPALPAGVMRVYLRGENGEPRFIGEDQISHSPAGSDLVISTGKAFDVTVQPRLVSSERVSTRRADRWRTRYAMEYRVRNATGEAKTVEVRQRVYGRDTELTAQSIEGELADAYTAVWKVQVPANGETVLTATITTGG